MMVARWLKFGGIVSSLCVTAVMAVAQAEPDLPDVIKKVIDASKKLKYSGTRVVLLKFGPDQQKHVEFVRRNGVNTRIEFPEEGSFRGQIIVENGDERRHYFPDKNQIEVLPARREEFSGRWLQKGRRGPMPEFKVENGPTIAGIATKEVEMSGKNGGVFLRLWVDPKSGLVLKREMYDRGGVVQASSEFTQVNFRPQFSRADFNLNIPGAKLITPRDRLAEILGRADFSNISLPPKGPFRLESCRIQRIGNVSALVQDYVNKDGRITLWQVKADIDPERLKRFGRGEVNAYSWQKGGSSFVLLGNLPEGKLKDLAQKLGG